VFHIGIDIAGNFTDCVLIDQAAPDAAVTYQMARALSATERPADRVLAGLAELAQTAGLGQRELLARTTRFCPGTGKPQLEYKVIRIQVIRPPAPWPGQQELWRKFLTVSHELLRRPGHPRQEDYRKRLGSGGHARDALTEGVVSLLTEIVWSDVLPGVRGAALRAAIAGGHAIEPSPGPGQVPHPAYDRYASMAELMRLLHVVGSARNVFAAFFLGDVDKMTGPVSLAVMGSPGAPLPAREVAALVARLNAVPAAERQRLRISLFARAPREEIDRLLTEPGADILAVWTADGTSAGAASPAGTASDDGTPSDTAALVAAETGLSAAQAALRAA